MQTRGTFSFLLLLGRDVYENYHKREKGKEHIAAHDFLWGFYPTETEGLLLSMPSVQSASLDSSCISTYCCSVVFSDQCLTSWTPFRVDIVEKQIVWCVSLVCMLNLVQLKTPALQATCHGIIWSTSHTPSGLYNGPRSAYLYSLTRSTVSWICPADNWKKKEKGVCSVVLLAIGAWYSNRGVWT